MDTTEKRAKVAALIRAYLDMGGLQLQVNGVGAQTLREAYETPARYEHLIVRIGGHSQRFNDLADEVKREFIERTALEEAGGAGA